jgi:hypothetical protein
VGDDAAAAGVEPEEAVARLLDPGAAVVEVDVQDLVPVAEALVHLV